MIGTLNNVRTDGTNVDEAVDRLQTMITENIDDDFEVHPSFNKNVDDIVERFKEQGRVKIIEELQKM